MSRRPPWRAVGEAVLATELCLLAASPFVDLFQPNVLAWRLLVAALAALVPGVLMRLRGARPPALLSASVAVAVFVLVATVVSFSDIATAAVLPGPDVLSGIRGGVVDGSRQILTSAVPAPNSGELLVVPVALVFWTVTVATEFTWRTRTRLVAPAAAVALFGCSLAFEPAGSSGHLMEAALIAGLSLLYVVSRTRSSAGVITEDVTEGGGAAERSRSAGVAVVGVAALVGVAMLLAAAVPVSSDRFALRDSVEAPLEPLEQINPLLLVNPVQRGDVVPTPVLNLSTSDASLEMMRLPIARLDRYDCDAGGFRSSGRAVASAQDLPPLGSDPPTTVVAVNLVGAESRVLPAPGNVVSLAVADGRPVYVDPSDRLLLVESTPIDGVEYRVRSAVEADVTGEATFEVGSSSPSAEGVLDCEASDQVDLGSVVAQAGLAKVSGQGRLQALAGWCLGLAADPEAESADDLSLGRLFGPGTADTPSVVSAGRGSAAQVVTACAVLGQRAGLPVRVAVGYVAGFKDGSADAMTTDLSTWVEVRDSDGLWHPVPVLGELAPSAGAPPESSPDQNQAGTDDVSPPPNDPSRFQPSTAEDDDGSGAPWILLVGAVIMAGGVVAWRTTRGARRRRRRRSGTPSQRLAGAWLETVDSLSAVGIEADAFGPEDIARTAEAFPAARQPLEQLGGLFATTFAPDPPTAQHADDAWVAVDQLRRVLRSRGTAASGPDRPGAPPADDVIVDLTSPIPDPAGV